MSLRSQFGSDKSKEQQGVWIDICENDDGTQCRMKIGRMSITNKKFARETAKRAKKYRGRMDSIPLEKQLKDNIEVFVDTTLFGWENVVDYRQTVDEGKPLPQLPFTRDNAIWLLNDLPSLFDLITTEASEISNFQTNNEVEAKNFGSSSVTS